MPRSRREVTLTINLSYELTAAEVALLEGDDEDSERALDQAVLAEVFALTDVSAFGGSRFHVGLINASSGRAWITGSV